MLSRVGPPRFQYPRIVGRRSHSLAGPTLLDWAPEEQHDQAAVLADFRQPEGFWLKDSASILAYL